LRRLKGMAQKYNLTIFPEIHAEFGAGIHEEIAREGYPIYDFFFPGLVLDALERGEDLAETRGLSPEERRWLLREIKKVMAVYSGRCSAV